MEQPLVSIICISYNHERFVYKALSSLRNQQYTNIEVIIADDCSTDQTQQEIQRFILEHSNLHWTILFTPVNQGNCKTFNEALKYASGKYVMDFAADDLLYSQCIEKLVDRFEQLSENYGVVFSNVDLMDTEDQLLSKHYPTDALGHAVREIPEGDVYQNIVKRYFISPVGMMMKRSVLEQLGGYDETLSYEDFDFWIRSSRIWHYAYVDECLVAKRQTPYSLSSRFSRKGNNHMFASTARVCQKIAWLNRTTIEDEALDCRITYEIRQSIRYGAYDASSIYLKLMKDLNLNLAKRMFYKIAVLLMG